MNSPSTIEISKSSLLSLKAEVLRKQQEVNKAKLQAKVQQPTLLKPKTPKTDFQNEPHNKGVKERQERDQTEEEEVELLRKSRAMLESKARLYDRLSKGPANLTEEEIEMNQRLLVQFDRKPREHIRDDSDEEYFSDEYEPAKNSDEEWVDYVDCLGRTRRCLRKDLSYLIEKDKELSETVSARWSTKDTSNREHDENIKKTESANLEETTESHSFSENSELLSNDMRRELMRKEWEKQEEELLTKNDIHYQDIIFNEARTHGVGYYAFSKDEEKRARQQEELRRLREETTQQQKASLEQKALREKQLAARLKAAKNRRRARLGLPPEEDEPEEPAAPAVEEQSEEEKNKQTAKEIEEKAKEEARRRMVRPWDIGKEGLKKHYEHTQEEWVTKKRSERPKEFAPPPIYETTHKHNTPEEDLPEANKSLYFSTKRRKDDSRVTNIKSADNLKESIHKSEARGDSYSFTPTPIVDEGDGSHDESESETRRKSTKEWGAEIAPPSTYEYYGPTVTKSAGFASTQSLEDSISAGLKYLREQAEKRELAAAKRKFLE